MNKQIFGLFLALHFIAPVVQADEQNSPQDKMMEKAQVIWDGTLVLGTKLFEDLNQTGKQVKGWVKRKVSELQSFPINYTVQQDGDEAVVITMELLELRTGKPVKSGSKNFKDFKLVIPCKNGDITLDLHNFDQNSEYPYAIMNLKSNFEKIGRYEGSEFKFNDERTKPTVLPVLNFENVDIKLLPESTKIQVTIEKADAAKRYTKEVEI